MASHLNVAGRHYHCPGCLLSISALPVSEPIATLCPSGYARVGFGRPAYLTACLLTPLRKIPTVVLENFLWLLTPRGALIAMC